MGPTRIAMSLLPYTSPYARYGYGYGAPYGAYGGYGPGFYGAGYPYGPYGMTAEEIQKVREAEEKAFNDAETKRKEFMEAEKKKYEEFVAAEKKKYEDYVSAQKKARGCHHKGEGARRKAWTIRLWPIWPSRRFRWIWLWSIWPPILLDECSPAMRCVEHNVMLRSARSMELSREEPLAFLMINAQRCP